MFYKSSVFLLAVLFLFGACSPDNPTTVNDLEEEITNLLDEEEGTYALFYKDLNNPGSADHHQPGYDVPRGQHNENPRDD